MNNKAASEYGRAIQLLQDGYIREAIPVLQKSAALQSNFADAYLSLGGAYGQLKDYRNSVAAYEKARSIDSVYFLYYNLPYSINLAGLGNFAEAMNAVERFAIPALGDKSTKSAIYRKTAMPLHWTMLRNTRKIITCLHRKTWATVLILNSRNIIPRSPSTIARLFYKKGKRYPRRFYREQENKNGYSKAVKINGSLNEEPSKGGTNISQDGEWLILPAILQAKAWVISISISLYNTPTGWSEPINMGANINTGFWESSPSVAPDKNAIYFSSDRPGGYGGRDLYVSYRSTSGKWSPAENMGPGINTNGDEIAPLFTLTTKHCTTHRVV